MDRKRNVLIIHHTSGLGGGTKSMFDLANMLKDKYNVTICIPENSTEIVNIAKSEGISFYQTKTAIPSLNIYSGMPGYFSRYFIDRLLRFRYNKKLCTELLELKPDCIIYNSVVTSLIAKDIPDTIKNICIVRETFLNNIFLNIYRNIFRKKFCGVAYIAKHEMDLLNIKNVSQTVIPDCLDPESIVLDDNKIAELRCKYKIDDSVYSCLFLGGLVQIKGLDVILKAFENLDGKFKLIIGGYFNEEQLTVKYWIKHISNIKNILFLYKVKKRLKPLIERDQVVITGFTNDISSIMAISDVVVFPSTSAHQPRPCIEAGNYNKPVILSDYEATKEYFIDGYNALTFHPKDANDLKNKIIILSSNKTLSKKMGMNNNSATKSMHNYNATKDKLRSFIENLI